MRHDSAGYWWLVERYRRLGYEARAITERYDEHLEDVLVTVFYARRFGFATLLVDLLAQSGNAWLEPSAGRRMMQP